MRNRPLGGADAAALPRRRATRGARGEDRGRSAPPTRRCWSRRRAARVLIHPSPRGEPQGDDAVRPQGGGAAARRLGIAQLRSNTDQHCGEADLPDSQGCAKVDRAEQLGDDGPASEGEQQEK